MNLQLQQQIDYNKITQKNYREENYIIWYNDALELHYKIAEQRHIKTEDYNKLQEIKAKAGCNLRDLQFKATGYPVSYKRVRK